MPLRDSSWVWDTTTSTVKDSQANLVSQDAQTRTVFTTGGSSFTKQDETSVYEWICLSKTAAESLIGGVLTDTTTWVTSRTFEMNEDNRILGSATITMTEITRGSWA